jgi:LPXTG-site transpeptidase (sortase) family protein
MTQRSRKAKLFRLIGSMCIGGAVFFAGVIINRLWISNYFSDKAAEQSREELLASWNRPTETTIPFLAPASTIAPGEIGPINTPTNQEAFALLYIPRIGNDVWATPIFEGVQSKQLNSGIGHYPQSQIPGEDGNFSLFGHRNSHGQPLINIQDLQVGDEVIVETKDFWFVYTLKHDKIVRPSATWVTGVNRRPELGLAADEPYEVITLITCEPRHSTDKRWVWWGVLKAVYPHSTPPPALAKPNN